MRRMKGKRDGGRERKMDVWNKTRKKKRRDGNSKVGWEIEREEEREG